VFATFDESIKSIKQFVGQPEILNNIQFLDFTTAPEMLHSGSKAVDLSGLLIRIEYAITKSGAKKLVLDAFDTMLLNFDSVGMVHREIHRVFHWCRQHGVTLVATTGTPAGYEYSTDVMDYASDTTILLQQIMENGLMTRKLRVLKLRGRPHGTNQYPFTIDRDGVTILPVTDTALTAKPQTRRYKTNIPELDRMLGENGLLLNSITMISWQSGSGNSLLTYKIMASALSAGI